MRTILLIASVAAALFVCSFALSQAPDDVKALKPGSAVAPATAPATQPADFIVSNVRIQQFPAMTYVYAQTQTTLNQIGPVAEQMMTKVHQAMLDGHVAMLGAPIFVYHGATPDPNKPFKLEVGFPVAEGTKAPADLKVRKLDAFHCATVLYSGGMASIGQGYAKLYQGLFPAGHRPTEEMREMYLYWEDPQSPNNIVQLQAGIQ